MQPYSKVLQIVQFDLFVSCLQLDVQLHIPTEFRTSRTLLFYILKLDFLTRLIWSFPFFISVQLGVDHEVNTSAEFSEPENLLFESRAVFYVILSLNSHLLTGADTRRRQ